MVFIFRVEAAFQICRAAEQCLRLRHTEVLTIVECSTYSIGPGEPVSEGYCQLLNWSLKHLFKSEITQWAEGGQPPPLQLQTT